MKLRKPLAFLILLTTILSSGCVTIQYENETARLASQIADEYTVATVVIENVLTLHTAGILSDEDLQNLETPIDEHKRSLDSAKEALELGDTRQAKAHLDVVNRLSSLLNTYLDKYWEQYNESADGSPSSETRD